MSRYTKNHSNYVLRRKHQNTNGGTIFEKDWVTIGSKDRYLTWDKRTSYHGDSNFVFTVSNFPSYSRKHKNSDWVGRWTYGDVENSSNVSNEVKVNYYSKDVRDFSYYGSAMGLIETSIKNIVVNFPPYVEVETENGDNGKKFFSKEDFESMANNMSDKNRLPYEGGIIRKLEDGTEVELPNFNELYVIKNDFLLDFWHDNLKIDDENEASKFLSLSFEKYQYTTDGITFKNFLKKPLIQYIGKKPLCNTIELLWKVILGNDNEVELYGVSYNDDIIFLVKYNINFKIVPTKKYYESFFNNLDGFEAQLMSRKTKPFYSNTFVTPVDTEYGFIEVDRRYTWPSTEINVQTAIVKNGDDVTFLGSEYLYVPIVINNSTYYEYVDNLIKLGEKLDKGYSDNIWNHMVHEAIKNYDWSYKRETDEDIAEANLFGGQKVEKIIRIFGRGFDDIKRSIDGIKNTTNITYDSYNNVTEAELSDKLDINGWDVYSTIPLFDGVNVDNLEMGTLYANNYCNYKGYYTAHLTPTLMDNEFMRRFNLNSKRILSSKGTIESIDMIMGMFGFSRDNKDYEIIEDFYKTKLKPIDRTYQTPDGQVIERSETFYDKLYGENDENYIEETNKLKYNMKLYYSDDIYSGIPLKEIYIMENGKNYRLLAPYYNHKQRYDSGTERFKEFYFQMNGGWGKFDDDDCFDNVDYLETYNYLIVVGTLNDLFSFNESCDEDDIIYVVNTSNYCDYYTTDDNCPPESHFFVCRDKYAINDPSGWENVDLNDDNKDSRFAKYLDGIINDNIGNNPHVGYGKYDLGSEYWKYIEDPFKYAFDSKRLDETDEAGNVIEVINKGHEASKFTIEKEIIYINKATCNKISKEEYEKLDDDKKNMYDETTINLSHRIVHKDDNRYWYEDDENGNPTKTKSRMLNYYFCDRRNGCNKLKNDNYEKTHEKLYNIIKRNSEFNEDDFFNENDNFNYALNSKVIIFKNNINNDFYKTYFKNVIFKYLSQVIPSTAILKFEGF